MENYIIGIDYGTLSARAILTCVSNGAVAAEAEFVYPHGVLNFTGKKTDAYQHPQDYLDALSVCVTQLLEKANVPRESVVSIGMDFTACTVLPVDAEGTPLCFLQAYKDEPQAYAKLWKHQSAHRQAERITRLAEETGAPWLKCYGGKVSAEWFFPKLLELYETAPRVYEACDQYMEAADWLTQLLTGQTVRSSCMAGYKALWSQENGYPDNGFWEKLGLSDVIGTKVRGEVRNLGTKAGLLNAAGAELTGLPAGIPVSVPMIDAHAGLPAAGVAEEGKLVLIMGTSSCQLMLSWADVQPKGISGSVKNGVLPGFTGLESGQASVGDTFHWFVKNAVPESYSCQAAAEGKNIYHYLTEKAQALKPGDSGLLALDWFNGNRVPYADGSLTGMLVGLNLQTKPEEIFLALMESTAYGTRQIVEIYENNGVNVREIYATGGIPQKNPFLMQLYADILGKEIRVISASQGAAKGSAILAAAAAGVYTDIPAATKAMADKWDVAYYPRPENTQIYDRLYEQYCRMSVFFATDPVMKELKKA